MFRPCSAIIGFTKRMVLNKVHSFAIQVQVQVQVTLRYLKTKHLSAQLFFVRFITSTIKKNFDSSKCVDAWPHGTG